MLTWFTDPWKMAVCITITDLCQIDINLMSKYAYAYDLKYLLFVPVMLHLCLSVENCKAVERYILAKGGYRTMYYSLHRKTGYLLIATCSISLINTALKYKRRSYWVKNGMWDCGRQFSKGMVRRVHYCLLVEHCFDLPI